MHWVEQQWERRGLWSTLLLPAAWLFGIVVALRRQAYRRGILDSHRLPVPVIVVGNISVGGTGKTPLVLWLAGRLRERGRRPGIVSRGYGGAARQPQPATPAADPLQVGDEPALLARRAGCPVWVGKDRVAAAMALLAAHPECDVIVSDDGLQHYQLRRDFEIAVFDGRRGIGNGCLLPAGPLREPPSRLREADAVVANDSSDMKNAFGMQLRGETFHNLTDAARTARPGDFAGKRLHAIAGIGSPQRFFEQLRRMGLAAQTHAFPDHHAFTAGDLQIAGADAILMTEKDAVKCAAFAQPHWWFLEVNAEVDDALVDGILNKIGNDDGRKAA